MTCPRCLRKVKVASVNNETKQAMDAGEHVVGYYKNKEVVLKVYELHLTDPPTVIDKNGGHALGAFVESWIWDKDLLRIEILPKHGVVLVTYLRK